MAYPANIWPAANDMRASYRRCPQDLRYEERDYPFYAGAEVTARAAGVRWRLASVGSAVSPLLGELVAAGTTVCRTRGTRNSRSHHPQLPQDSCHADR